MIAPLTWGNWGLKDGRESCCLSGLVRICMCVVYVCVCSHTCACASIWWRSEVSHRYLCNPRFTFLTKFSYFYVALTDSAELTGQ